MVAEEVLLLEECADLLPEKHAVKLLFYNDSNQLLQLLIGTGALDQSDSESQTEQHNKEPEESYFVSIQIEETFLRWLDDPDFIE